MTGNAQKIRTLLFLSRTDLCRYTFRFRSLGLKCRLKVPFTTKALSRITVNCKVKASIYLDPWAPPSEHRVSKSKLVVSSSSRYIWTTANEYPEKLSWWRGPRWRGKSALPLSCTPRITTGYIRWQIVWTLYSSEHLVS